MEDIDEDDDDILEGIQTPPEHIQQIVEKNLDNISVLSTPMFNKNYNEINGRYR